MSHLKPVKIELKPSILMKGEVGLFAAAPLKAREVVIEAKAFSDEKLVTWEEYNKLDSVTKRKIMDFCCGRDEGFYAPKDLNLISIAWHMNHSCDPNIGFDKSYNFVAMRNIKKGEELVWDYCYDETNPKFKLNCLCNTKKCRKRISGNDWKKATEFGFKNEFISPHLRKLIKSNSK